MPTSEHAASLQSMLGLRGRRRILSEDLAYTPELDGLRALAVVGVMVYHAGFTWLSGGFLGVSTFFTLSGFLITSLLLREWNSTSRIEVRQFFRRRFRRLLPASWATIGIVLVMGILGVWNTDQLRALRGDVPFALAEIINWHFVAQGRGYGASFVAPSPLEHYWSLAVEQQFYVILPLLTLALLSIPQVRTQRVRVRILMGSFAVLAVASAVLNGVFARSSIDRAYFGTDTRMTELLVGAILGCLLLRRLRMPRGSAAHIGGVALGIVGLVLTVWMWSNATLDSSWLYPWGLLLTAAASTALVFGILQGGPVAWVLSLPPIVWLGRISYGVYLLHWPIFLWLTPLRTGLSPVPLFALRFALTLAAAAVMFHVLEHPMRIRPKLPLGRVAGALGISVVAILAATFWVTRDLPPPERITVAEDPPPVEDLPPPLLTATIVGDQLGIAFFGQSTDDERLVIEHIPSAECGLVVGGQVALGNGLSERDTDRCAGVRDAALARLDGTRSDVNLLLPAMRDAAGRRFTPDEPWLRPGDEAYDSFVRAELIAAVDGARAAGVEPTLVTLPQLQRSLALEPAPFAHISDPEQAEIDRSYRNYIGKNAPVELVENDPEAVAALNQIVVEVAAESGVAVIDLAAHVASWAGGAFDPQMRAADGVSTTEAGATEMRAWLDGVLRERVPPPAVGPPPPLIDPNTPLPVPPPSSARRSVPAGSPAQVMFVGDSVTYGLGESFAEVSSDEIRSTVAARFGCAIGRGGFYKFQNDLVGFDEGCDWARNFPNEVASVRPDVVVLGSGIWEVVDRRFEGDSRFRQIGSPDVDRFLLGEFLGAIDTLGADGAHVAVLTQPLIQSGMDKGLVDLPESEPARMERLNELLAEAVALRPGVATLIDLRGWLQGQPGGELDPAKRPDGVHFADTFAPEVARWLEPQLLGLARG